MNIPVTDLTRQYKTLMRQINRDVISVFKKGNFILGDEVERFEKQYAAYIGVRHCMGVANGTEALRLILTALGIGKGDEVITQANTFIATVLPVLELGARVVLVDADETTASINPEAVERAITTKTRVIIPVHLFGYPAPMRELMKISKRKSTIHIIEDAAQAHGSSMNGKRMGSFGLASGFSFYPGKNLGAYGDAGGIVTNNNTLAEKIRILRNIGQVKKYHHTVRGFNSRLDTVQAAILSVKLKHLDRWNKQRNRIALRYQKELKKVGDITLPPLPPNGISTNYHQFVITTTKRDALTQYLKKHGISTGIHYPFPLHLTPALAELGYKKGDFPVSEKRAKAMLSIPMFPEMKDEEQEFIISKIQSFFH